MAIYKKVNMKKLEEAGGLHEQAVNWHGGIQGI